MARWGSVALSVASSVRVDGVLGIFRSQRRVECRVDGVLGIFRSQRRVDGVLGD